MKYEEIKIQTEGSAENSRLETYILDTPSDKDLKVQKRPMIVICPGGAYEKTSFREGEPLALHFLNQGYHACVLRYSVAPHRFPTQLLELGTAIRTIHEHADEWKVDEELIFVHGASAGGHLAASYGAFWNQEFMSSGLQTTADVLKVKGLLLSYPVITSDPEYAHMGSFKNLLEHRIVCEPMNLQGRAIVNILFVSHFHLFAPPANLRGLILVLLPEICEALPELLLFEAPSP